MMSTTKTEAGIEATSKIQNAPKMRGLQGSMHNEANQVQCQERFLELNVASKKVVRSLVAKGYAKLHQDGSNFV